MKQLRQDADGVVNTTAHFMEFAKAYLMQGDTEYAKACLMLLCEYCDNYEESLAFNDLLEDWHEISHLVDGLVPPSVQTYAAPPCTPTECSMIINDILSLDGESLLAALSVHLGELSGNGEEVQLLNEWESTVFYVDELWTEVNLGGFDSYLYHRGTHFEDAYKACQRIKANDVVAILKSVRRKIDVSKDFEAEDTLFYTVGEKELLERVSAFVKANNGRFR